MKLNQEPIDLALLRSFMAIAETGSFLEAAQRVGRSPSAVSMQVKRLEQTLETKLFVRNAQETSLTRDGDRLLQHARHLLAGELEMRNAFRSEPMVGQITLGVPDDVIERFPMQVIREFGDQYPDVAVTITVGHTPALLDAVNDQSIDLAIVTYAESIPGIAKAERIYQEPETRAGLRGGRAVLQSPLPVVLWEDGWAWYMNAVDILDQAKIDYRIVMKSENINARKNAIEADFAVGPLPMSQLGDRLVPVPQLEQLPPLPKYSLGLRILEDASAPAKTLGEFLKTSIDYTAQAG